MKSVRLDFSGGINVVGNKSTINPSFATIIDNGDIRDGGISPVKAPRYEYGVTVTNSNIDIFRFDGVFYLSNKMRDYVAQKVNGVSQIFYTEYGSEPRKIINGVDAKLGTARPKLPPLVAESNMLSPSVSLVVMPNEGSFKTGDVRSYRVAAETADGVMPASQSVRVTIGNTGTTWTQAEIDILAQEAVNNGTFLSELPSLMALVGTTKDMGACGIRVAWTSVEGAIKYYIYGSNGGEETLIYTSIGTATSWTDAGSNGANGEPVSSRVSLAPVTYFYTFIRSVGGVVDESGPSSLSLTASSRSGRLITFDPKQDGFLGQDGAITSATGYTITISSSVSASKTVSSVVRALVPTSIKVTTSTAHGFTHGSFVRFTGTDDPNWKGKDIQVYPDVSNASVFYVDGLPLPESNPTGVLASLTQVELTAGQTMPAVDDAVIATVNGVTKPYRVKSLDSATKFTIFGFSDATMTFSSLSWVPSSPIKMRKLYRTSTATEGFFLVSEIPIWDIDYFDAKADERLGDAPTSYYKEDGVDIIFDVPPKGMSSIVEHYGMLFAIDGTKVRYTPIGRYDAWPDNYYFTFPNPVKLMATQQSLIVLCLDAIWRIDGNTPNGLSVTRTHAEDGCDAPGTAVKTSSGLLYKSKRGIMLFDGMSARCITENKIPSSFFNGPSASPGSTGFFWQPTLATYNYSNLAQEDGILARVGNSRLIRNTNPLSGPNLDAKAFVYDGKYYLYWSNISGNYACNTTVCIDLKRDGFPISTLGLKPVDVYVDEYERPWALLDGEVSSVIKFGEIVISPSLGGGGV